MDTLTSILAVMALSLLLAAWHARRIGNDSRDVRCLQAFCGATGMGAALSAWL